MALYSDFISLLRQDNNDFGKRCYETADGDGTTTVFNLSIPNGKVLESSYTVKVNGILQIENTAYIMYPDIGQVVFATGSAPAAGNDVVEIQYQSVILRDTDYVDLVNQQLQQLRRKLWIEATDESTLSSVTNQNTYDLAAVKTAGGFSDIVYVINVQLKEVSNATTPPSQTSDIANVWRDAKTVTNIRFYRDLQQLRMRPAFNAAGFPMRLFMCRAYIQGTSSTSTFEPQTKYWPTLRKYCQAEYLNRFVGYLLKNSMTAVSKEKTFEDLNNLRKMVDDVTNQAHKMLSQVRPQKPAAMIPISIYGIGDV